MTPVARTPRNSIALFGIPAAVALTAGAMACLWLPWLAPFGCSLSLLGAGLVAWATGWRGRSAGSSANMVARVAGAFLCGFALAGLHAVHSLGMQLPMSLEKHEFIVTGRIVDLPVQEPRRTRFVFEVDADGAAADALRGRRLQLSWYAPEHRGPRPGPATEDPRAALRAGQRWTLPVRLRPPRGLRNPGGGDGERFAMVDRLTATGYVYAPAMARLRAPAAGIQAWRERMSARIARDAGGSSSRFIRALALGDTRGLLDEDWVTLRANGLTHLIAISGFHVGLAAGFFALLVRGMWWSWPALARRCPATVAAALAATAGACIYAVATGLALPTLRTVLMIGVVALARAGRRPARAAHALALAGIVLVLADPLSVLGAGFWLSFLGVAWLICCLPQAGSRPVRDFLSAQGVATLGLLPATVLLFGQASLAGPVANLVAVPWWSLVVVPCSLIGLLLEAVVPGAGAWLWQVAGWCFDLSWPLFRWLGSSDLAVVWLAEPSALALPLAMLGAFWLLLPRGTPGKVLAVLLWLPLLWPDRGLPGPGEAEVRVIDVGQGLSVLVRTHRHTLLYDMGPAVRDGFDAGERAVVPTLHALGAGRVDRAVISHGDNDHAGGFAAVAAEFPVASLLAPARSAVPGTTAPCIAGEQWSWDGVAFRFLHPPPHFPYLANESSCVLQIRSPHGRVLLTGDIGEVIERDLLRRYGDDLRSDVAVVAHHGSGGSSDAGFVAATHARWALVSSGWGNRFGHPRAEVMARWRAAGAQTADTAVDGALRVHLRAGGIAIERQRRVQPRLWDAAHRH